MGTVEIIRAVNALLNLLVGAGISLARISQMREESGGDLTDEQVQMLADEADEVRESL